LFIVGNWNQEESFLQAAQKGRPQHATLLSVLAVCQARRGKLQTALLSARQACTPEPRDKEHAKILIDLLLDGGFLREAQERLQKLQSESQTDTELMFAMVRLNLMLRRREKAGEWTEVLKRSSPEANTLVQLGRIYEDGRQQEHAAALYTEALSRGHYPEAHLGLGRLAAGKHKEQAR